MVIALANTAKTPKTALIMSPFEADCVEKEGGLEPWSPEGTRDSDIVAKWIFR